MSPIQVRIPTVEITEDARRAIRFTNTRRQTMCSRKEAQEFILTAIQEKLQDAMYRLYGDNTPKAVLAGANADSFAGAGANASSGDSTDS